jgi:hypothetical protein
MTLMILEEIGGFDVSTELVIVFSVVRNDGLVKLLVQDQIVLYLLDRVENWTNLPPTSPSKNILKNIL